jgi:hypothetical protein
VLIVLAIGGAHPGLIAQLINANAGYVVVHHDDRPLHGVRDVPLLLPRARELRSCATCRSSTRSAAITPRTTTWDHDARQHEPDVPIADWAMGTSDLKRGLLGHLFNGYSEQHVKEELKPMIARFRTSKTQDERVTLEGPVLTDEESRTLAHATGQA